MEIIYRTSEGCDYDSREVTQHVRDFVDRGGSAGSLVELLVERGILTLDDVFDKFKKFGDYERIE